MPRLLGSNGALVTCPPCRLECLSARTATARAAGHDHLACAGILSGSTGSAIRTARVVKPIGSTH
ncbi:hypothetical protein GCM10010207_84030 [Streptomyces atratus]|nr:hypothetical protein GCM10010207_84030 [Streptomyces atratus]